jgi:dTDP-glucose pyrophosphorylase
MGALTASTPKSLLAVRGQPIIDHIVRGLRAAGTREVVLVTGYRGEQITAHLGDGAALGVHITYRSQARLEGSARALLLARDAAGTQPFIVSWGDILVHPDTYRALLAAFRQRPSDALLMVNATDDPWRGAAVYVDADWRVTHLVEKPPRGASATRWNNAGLFIFTPLIFRYAEQLVPSARGEYELPQAVGRILG